MDQFIIMITNIPIKISPIEFSSKLNIKILIKIVLAVVVNSIIPSLKFKICSYPKLYSDTFYILILRMTVKYIFFYDYSVKYYFYDLKSDNGKWCTLDINTTLHKILSFS